MTRRGRYILATDIITVVHARYLVLATFIHSFIRLLNQSTRNHKNHKKNFKKHAEKHIHIYK